ncbi:uncharacterized protein LY79DRAFT_580759 [Colletotrichum navitas]|uniref:Uncharacterized protein n=1 Tax=Colletotrichum navitas TaxID=681940 RepID=A0AAD8PWD6_9PEZI|nr:uncharacterized protein LY79DRAFT_580759 [Colletotrichum navitas]KAK1585920.1 hypothetical protein LY79DRAFT_580759 [Colletotrichum navitas]
MSSPSCWLLPALPRQWHAWSLITAINITGGRMVHDLSPLPPKRPGSLILRASVLSAPAVFWLQQQQRWVCISPMHFNPLSTNNAHWLWIVDVTPAFSYISRFARYIIPFPTPSPPHHHQCGAIFCLVLGLSSSLGRFSRPSSPLVYHGRDMHDDRASLLWAHVNADMRPPLECFEANRSLLTLPYCPVLWLVGQRTIRKGRQADHQKQHVPMRLACRVWGWRSYRLELLPVQSVQAPDENIGSSDIT